MNGLLLAFAALLKKLLLAFAALNTLSLSLQVEGDLVKKVAVCQQAWKLAYGISNDRVAKAKSLVVGGATRVVHGRTGML